MSDTQSAPASAVRNVSLQLPDGRIVNADIEGFDALSADAQSAALHQVAQSYTSQNSLQPPSAPADTSFTGALQYGAHAAAEGLGKTAELVGNATGWNGLASAGKTLEGATSAPVNYQPTHIASDLKAGNYLDALKALPRAATEGAADMAGYLGAGAVAGPIGVAGVAAARNLGDNVAQRAANNNDPTPTAGDWAGGGLTTAAQAGLAAVGLGKAGIGRTMLAAAPTLAKPIVAAGLDAGAGAASDAVGQVGTSAGTDQGVVYDPYQTAAAGLQAGVGRLASTVPELAAVGIRSGADAAMSALQPAPASVDDAASVVRVANDIQRYQAAAKAAGGDVSFQAAANSVKSDYVAAARDAITALKNAPSGANITTAQARSATDLFNQAQRSNNTLADLPGALFQQVNDWNVSDDTVTAVKQAALDLNTLAGQSFQNRANGPFRQLGKGVATLAGAGGALAAGSPLAAIGIMSAGHGYVSPAGAAIGGALDRAFGTNTPTVLLRANAARKMLAATGTDAGPSSLGGLQSLTAATNALPPSPGPSIADLAQARLDASAKLNAVKLAVASAGKMPAPHPEVDDTAADAAVNSALRQADAVVRQAGNVPVAPAGWGGTPLPATPPAATSPSATSPSATPPATAPAPAVSSDMAAIGLTAAPTQTSPGAPPAAATGGALPPMPAGPGATPSDSLGGPVSVPPGPASGTASQLPMTAPAAHAAAAPWERYVASGDPTITRADVHQAVGDVLPADQADILKVWQGPVSAQLLRPIQERIALSRRASSTAGVGLPASGPSEAVSSAAAAPDAMAQVGLRSGGVRNPYSYVGAINNYRATVMGQVAAAHAAGVPEAVPMLHAVLQAHGQTPEATRQAKVQAAAMALQTVKSAERRAAAVAFLTRPLLAHGGPRQTTR